jgi:hypothetical protein
MADRPFCLCQVSAFGTSSVRIGILVHVVRLVLAIDAGGLPARRAG